MKKLKLRKSIIFLIVILLLFSFWLLKRNSASSYSLEYKIESYDISENYDKEKKSYYFEIKENNLKYNFIKETKYIKKKKLIKSIRKIEENDTSCLLVESNLNIYPICRNKEEQIDYHLVNNSLKEELKDYFKEKEAEESDYKQYLLYNQEDKIIVWNYKGFIYFEEVNIEEFPVFNKDIYDIPLATRINEYILIPDYEQDYSFNKIYRINLKKKKIDSWTLKENISFDSYIVGTNNKSIFLVDNKNKIEYELAPHKKKIRIVGSEKKNGIIFKEGKEESISIIKLTREKVEFLYKNNYTFTLNNKKLYLSYMDASIKERISDKEVDKIIKVENEVVYYLVKDTLYKFNKEYGETKVIKYADWEFHHDNLIFFYNEI